MSATTSASAVPRCEADPSENWEMVAVGRIGAPPLRFAGRMVCSTTEGDLAIRIWQAKAGGFVLAHSVESPGREATSRHAQAEEVMRALEEFCHALEAPEDLLVDPEVLRRLHVSDLLEEIARVSDWRRRFRALAGEALDAFDRQQRPAASPQHGECLE